MNQSKLWLSVGAVACLFTCLAAIALPLWIGGGSVLALAAIWDWKAALCLFVLAAAGGGAWLMISRLADGRTPSMSSCRCKTVSESTAHTAAPDSNSHQPLTHQPLTHQPLICALSGPEMALQQEEITRFLNESLLEYRRDGQILELRFPANVEEQVRNMIRLEQECCSFLLFDIRKQGNQVLATIIVPEAIRDSTEEIFREFLPMASIAETKHMHGNQSV